MMMKKILVSAGEASGDIHAAKLISYVKAQVPDIKFYGMGGAKMHQAGAEIIVDSTSLGIIGLFDIFTHLPKLKFAIHTMCRLIKNDPPDLLILVDYPGFNLPLAEFAKKIGIKVLYYISPKVWASREWRVKKIKKYIDKMAVIFPFEVDYYKKFDIPVSFIGNPLTETVKPTMLLDTALQEFGLNPDHKILGLFPGSRKTEVKRMLPVLLKSAELLKEQFPDAQFILPRAISLTEDDLTLHLKRSSLKIKVVEGQNYDVMQVCDAIIAVSGTVTLEIALMEKPLVIIYKINPPYFPIQIFIKIPYIGLCNIIAGKGIAKEFIQQQANPKNISAEIAKILTDDQYRNNMIFELRKVKKKLIGRDKENIVKLVVDALHDK